MDKKEEKKGFGASLFSPTKKTCCCQTIVEEIEDKTVEKEKTSEKEKERDRLQACDCG